MPNQTEDLIEMIKVPESDLRDYLQTHVNDREMEAYFGEEASTVRQYATARSAPQKKGDSIIIVLPGLTGSVLENFGDEPEVLWINPVAYLKGHLNRLDLDAGGQKDATSGVRVEASRPIWLAYAKLVLRLQNEYETYCFPYDWRRAPSDHATALAKFIDEKIAASPLKQVTLVGHSMGGLVAYDYLIHSQTKAHAEKFVKRVITLGTPFRGAVPAIEGLARGDDPKMEVTHKLNRDNDPKRMLRSFPGMYEILPAPKSLYPDWDPVPKLDIWNAETWQAGSIPINTGHLKGALEHHKARAAADPQVPLYTVIGVYYETPVKLLGDTLTALPEKIREGLQGGDGTVEVSSAALKGRPAYYVNEVHIELVLEITVIEGIMHWADGGQPTGLVSSIDKVRLDDAPLRSAAPGFQSVTATPDDVARKINADEPLSRADIKAMMAGSWGSA